MRPPLDLEELARPPVALGLAVGWALLVGAATADAANDPADTLAVVSVVSGAADAPITAGRLEAAVATAADLRVGVRLVRNRALDHVRAGKLAAAVRRCGSDLRCAAAAFQVAGVQLGLIVGINLAFDPAFVSLNLVDALAGTGAAQWAGDVAATAAALEATLVERTGPLLDRVGYALGGRVLVQATPADTAISLERDGVRFAGAEGRFTVPAGRYTVVATHPGLDDATEDVLVLQGQTSQVVLTLSEPSVASSPWLWLGVAAAVLAGGAVTTAVLVGQGRQHCVCVTLPGGACEVCEP